jgi:hypothetical protein
MYRVRYASTAFDWNTANSFSVKIVLQALGWETHSAPEIGDCPLGLGFGTYWHRDIAKKVFPHHLPQRIPAHAGRTGRISGIFLWQLCEMGGLASLVTNHSPGRSRMGDKISSHRSRSPEMSTYRPLDEDWTLVS